jgi:hypothetical protein
MVQIESCRCENQEWREKVCVVYWYSFSNPRTECIHCSPTIECVLDARGRDGGIEHRVAGPKLEDTERRFESYARCRLLAGPRVAESFQHHLGHRGIARVQARVLGEKAVLPKSVDVSECHVTLHRTHTCVSHAALTSSYGQRDIPCRHTAMTRQHIANCLQEWRLGLELGLK